jgi:hypothetical protein
MNLFRKNLYKQKGQAMVFGLLFLAVSVMSLTVLYNQGQLVKNRVQVENAADAAVYSQAKLGARNLNFIAYTNRSMVANEVSIGQMVALLSWAKHYKQVGSFTDFPLYTIPIAPPSPTTMQQILSAVTTPWKIMGTAVEAPSKILVDKWPTVISYFNGAIGIFQKVFALSTLEAQIEMNLNVVADHEFEQDEQEIYTPVVGWYFFVQNTLLTYFGENFDPSTLYAQVSSSDTGNADGHALVADFLGDQVGTIDTMINDNTSGISRKTSKNTSGGRNSNLNSASEEDSAVEAYQRFAAIVNRNREAFTQDRHWRFGPPQVNVHLPLVINAGIVKLTIELDIGFWAGIKNDGGTAYVSKGSIESNADLASLGWRSMDVTSFGIQVDIGLFVNIEVCILGCTDWTLLDIDFSIPIGLPLAGSTHQLVSAPTHAKKTMLEWGYPSMNDSGMYGGDPDDNLNNGSFDLFHIAALGWGQVAPTLQPGGMYGVRPIDVTSTYGAPPSFFSLGSSFQETGVGYEYTIAIAKSLDDVETSDSDEIGINKGNKDDWDTGNIAFTRFDVETHSRAEGTDFAANYQQVAWSNDRPIMTVSSAETYFSNPMQSNNDGSDEPASLFSPFWDARQREPSAIALLIATGEIDWEEMFEGLSGEASDIVEWLLNGIGSRIVDTGVENLVAQMSPPFDSIVEPPVTEIANQAKDQAIESVMGELEEYLP